MIKKANILTLLLASVLFVFVANANETKAQFSDSWEFMKAVEEEDYPAMLRKIRSGANVDTRNADGIPTIVVASDKRNTKLMEFLLENGVNPNATVEGSNDTALMRRADAGDLDSIKLLMEYGADIDAANRTGETALMKAIRSRKRRAIIGLIELGADLDKADYTGRTALDYALDTRSTRLVKIIQDALDAS